MKRCDCPRGTALSSIPKTEEPRRPVFTERDNAIMVTIELLATIPWFPPKEEVNARLLVARELTRMCDTTAKLGHLATRMTRLYSAWPGVREMRILYCQTYVPLDGIDYANEPSAFYPKGIPPERPVRPEPQPLALPAGREVTVLADADHAVKDMAKVRTMPAVGRKGKPLSRVAAGA